MGGPRARYGRVRKISPPRRFDPRTVQPVAKTQEEVKLRKCNTSERNATVFVSKSVQPNQHVELLHKASQQQMHACVRIHHSTACTNGNTRHFARPQKEISIAAGE
jgi:hypothetical protein